MNKYVQDMGEIIVSEINLLIQELRDTIDNQRETIEQLENIRKEAIEWVTNHKEELHHSFDEPDWDYLLYGNATDLLNILNKGSNKE